MWDLRVCSWKARQGGETWSGSPPGGFDVDLVDLMWTWPGSPPGCGNDLWTHRTSSQAVPFGKTSSQLTRTVDKSIRSVSGAPFDSVIIFTCILYIIPTKYTCERICDYGSDCDLHPWKDWCWASSRRRRPSRWGWGAGPRSSATPPLLSSLIC